MSWRDHWHGGPRRVRDNLPVDYEHLPDSVILDLREPIKAFNDTMAECIESEAYAGEILQEALIYIADDTAAEEGLARFKIDMERNYPGAEGEQLAAASVALGEATLHQLRSGHLYAADGRLHYGVDERDWIDYVTPVLRKQAAVYTHRALAYFGQHHAHRPL